MYRKIYYELEEKRQQDTTKTDEFAIVRLEQLYPFHRDYLADLIASYPNCKELTWVQEEPQNMGAWSFISPRLQSVLPESISISYKGRKYSGSTAEGSGKSHKIEQQRIIDEAFFCSLWLATKDYLRKLIF